MIHLRAWRTMTMLTIEVSCTHAPGTSEGAHLIQRGCWHDVGDDPLETLDALAEMTHALAHAVRRGEDWGLSDECGLY